jgi:hypothetical protein
MFMVPLAATWQRHCLYIDGVLIDGSNGRLYETNASGTDTLTVDLGGIGEFNIGSNAAHGDLGARLVR